MRVLVAIFDGYQQDAWAGCLSRNGHEVKKASSSARLAREVTESRCEAVLMGRHARAIDGLRAVRAAGSRGSILLIVGSNPSERMEALEAGADECLVEPFLIGEVLARLERLSRRINCMPPEETSTLVASPFHVDLRSRQVRRGKNDIKLTKREFDLLVRLMRRPGQVFSPDALSEDSSGAFCVDSTTTIAVHIKNLRAKIDADRRRSFIRTERGCGYAFSQVPI